MKGVILKCLQDLVRTRFGPEKWQEILETAGVPTETIILAGGDMPDEQALGLLSATETVLGLTSEQAADAFGEHWMLVFAPRIYTGYFRHTHSARDFFLKLNEIHQTTVQGIEHARPPRFELKWEDDDALLVTYRSQRGLMDLFAGLARGVGLYFQQPLELTRVGTDALRIRFP